MKVIVQGEGELTLTKTHFLASGGEGDIYKKGNLIYKIYKGSPIPEGKIQELSALSDPRIIKPERLVFDQKNTLIGHTMRFAQGDPLCVTFPRAFKVNSGLSDGDLVEISLPLEGKEL